MSALPESVRAHLAARAARRPAEIVQEFLGGFVADATTLEEVHQDLRRVAATTTTGHRSDLAAIEALLADPPAPGGLSQLVAWDGNWVLDDPSDAGAAAFLRQLADMLREVIAEHA